MNSSLILFYLNLTLFSLNVILVIETIYQSLPCSEKRLHLRQGQQHHVTIGDDGRRSEIEITTQQYVAAILVQEEIEEDYDLTCVSVIVSVYFSLTTAHCIDIISRYHEKHVKVRSGSIFWQTGGVLHDIIFTIKHESYNRHFYDNDIGLVSVEPPFLKTRVAKVAGPNYQLVDESHINVTGWGETMEVEDDIIIEGSSGDNAKPTSELRTVVVKAVNKETCESLINGQNGQDQEWIRLDNSQFCTTGSIEDGDNGRKVCVYDSGGPAIQNHVLVGIVSWSDGGRRSRCGMRDYPGLYTNTRHLYEWLQKMSDRLKMHLEFV